MTDGHSSSCYVHGLSTAVPEQWVTWEQSVDLLKEACLTPRITKLFQRISRLTGIEKRHLAALDFQGNESPLYRAGDEQPNGPGTAERSAAFDQAAFTLVARVLSTLPHDHLARVDTVVTVSCTHASSPGLERPIFTSSPVPPEAQRWNLGFMGCSGGLAGMRLVHRMSRDGSLAMIVACELSSLHFQYSAEIDQMTANVLFADGAAAMLLSSRPSPVRVVDCRCVTFPAVADQMVWYAGDHGFQLRLSADLPDTLGAQLPGVVKSFLRANNLTLSDVDHWIVHPGGPQILESVQSSLGLSSEAMERSLSVFRRFGNMSSPTVFFILKDLLDSGAVGRTVALAFGPGLTIEMVLFQVGGR